MQDKEIFDLTKQGDQLATAYINVKELSNFFFDEENRGSLNSSIKGIKDIFNEYRDSTSVNDYKYIKVSLPYTSFNVFQLFIDIFEESPALHEAKAMIASTFDARATLTPEEQREFDTEMARKGFPNVGILREENKSEVIDLTSDSKFYLDSAYRYLDVKKSSIVGLNINEMKELINQFRKFGGNNVAHDTDSYIYMMYGSALEKETDIVERALSNQDLEVAQNLMDGLGITKFEFILPDKMIGDIARVNQIAVSDGAKPINVQKMIKNDGAEIE